MGAAWAMPAPDANVMRSSPFVHRRPPLARHPATRVPANVLQRLLLAVAVVYPIAYLVVAALRMAYPFELEWMEGVALEQTQRVLHAQPLYVAPSLGYIPLLYTPLYFHVAALATRILGDGFLALRAVSFAASLGCFVLIFTLVRRETRSTTAGTLAACMFAATYRLGGAWFDIARADSLHVMLLLAAALVLRADATRWRGPVAGGVLLTLAFLSKQSAVTVMAPLLLYELLSDRRRFMVLAATLVVLIAGSTLAIDLATHHWYSYYIFDIPSRHTIDPGLIPQFWSRDVMAPLAIAVLTSLLFLVLPGEAGRRPARGFYGALAAGLVACSWSLRMFRGGYDNVLMTAHAGIAILFGLGWHVVTEWIRGAGTDVTKRLASFVALAWVAQFVLLVYDPRQQLPTAADRASGDYLVRTLRSTAGDVLIPGHSYLAVRAGRAANFHEMPFIEIVNTAKTPLEHALMDSLRSRLARNAYSAVVLDNRDFLKKVVEDYYVTGWTVFDNDTVFWSRTGLITRPQAVARPRTP